MSERLSFSDIQASFFELQEATEENPEMLQALRDLAITIARENCSNDSLLSMIAEGFDGVENSEIQERVLELMQEHSRSGRELSAQKELEFGSDDNLNFIDDQNARTKELMAG